MAPMLLCLAIFGFWGVTGFGLLATRDKHRFLTNLLLAPVVGMATTLLSVYVVSRLGMPVGKAGLPITILLGAVAGCRIWYVRPIWESRCYAPFAAVFLVSVLVTGRPMFEFGFDWVSYCNDDMGNYCLGAQRLAVRGFDSPPDPERVVNGQDYADMFWFTQVVSKIRCGPELLLAWVMSVTGLSAIQAFMVTIVAFYLVLISTVGALVGAVPDRCGAAWWACMLTAASALTTLGVYYQLLGQVPGLSLLAGCTAALCRSVKDLTRAETLRRGALIGLLITSQLIVYPEVFPFLAVTYFVYLVMTVRHWLPRVPTLLAMLGTVCLVVLVLLNWHAVGLGRFLWMQAHGNGSDPELAALFPYYLDLGGLNYFWGLIGIGQPKLAEPWRTSALIFGACMLASGVCASLWLSWQKRPVALVSTVMLAVGACFVYQAAPFGLYKLAMFIQPFFMATLALAASQVFRRRWLCTLALFAVVAVGQPGRTYYTDSSRGLTDNLAEVYHASGMHIDRELKKTLKGHEHERVLADMYNPCLAKFAAIHSRGAACMFPSVIHFPNYGMCQWIDPTILSTYTQFCKQVPPVWQQLFFALGTEPTRQNPFLLTTTGSPPKGLQEFDGLLASTGLTSPLNRQKTRFAQKHPFVFIPWQDVRNHLLFVSSDRGYHYYALGNSCALHSLQSDPCFPGETFAGCGAHMLFLVANPSPTVRFEIELTASCRPGERLLPRITAIGTERQSVQLCGRGATRCYSPPLHPQFINGYPFVALDVEKPANEGPTGRREIISFIRNLSLVSEEEYHNRVAPLSLPHFTKDLHASEGAFSGIFEDGWLSESGWFEVARPPDGGILTLRCTVLPFEDPNFSTELTLVTDGTELSRHTLHIGETKVPVKVAAGVGVARIEFRFSRTQRPNNVDMRSIGAFVWDAEYTSAGSVPNYLNKNLDACIPAKCGP